MPILTLNEQKIEVRPHLSAVAPKNNKPSRAAQSAITFLKRHRVTRVCEVGCGLLSNTPHILKAFPFVILTDRKEQLPRIKDKLFQIGTKYPSYKGFIEDTNLLYHAHNLDAAIVINVIHILPRLRQRLDLLKTIYRTLRYGGFVFLDVPRNEFYYKRIVKTAQPYSDGYCMRRDGYFTFYKNMSLEEVKDLLRKAGFSFETQLYLDHRTTLVGTKATKNKDAKRQAKRHPNTA